MSSRAQIIATIGPSSEKPGVLKSMIEGQMDIARFNFEWFDLHADGSRIDAVRATAAECGRVISIIADLPGARVQLPEGHTYDASHPFSIPQRDEEMLRLCAEKQVEYVALSFVGSGEHVMRYREAIKNYSGSQKIIAKIERKAAVDAIDEIIGVSDAIMVARGDLGKEVPLEDIPFVQKMLIAKAHAAHKPVITATQMLLSMTEHPEPTRAEVTDVEEAIMEGSDAVMLSEETASGRFPVEAVAMMERIVAEAERHRRDHTLHLL
ncbi:MAG: pyruvate kinase [Minisyncoccota bacterium]